MTLPEHVSPVPLDKCYRLMNHGPTVLVSARHAGIDNAMAAAWACVLDHGAATKVTVVLDKATRTRELVDASGRFALQLPCVNQASMTVALGSHSAHDMPDKLQQLGAQTFDAPGHEVPLIEGCVGWLVCRLLPEPHNQTTYDLFIGQVEAAFADDRVFSQGRWHFDQAPDGLRTLHHVAGGQFLVPGRSVQG